MTKLLPISIIIYCMVTNGGADSFCEDAGYQDGGPDSVYLHSNVSNLGVQEKSLITITKMQVVRVLQLERSFAHFVSLKVLSKRSHNQGLFSCTARDNQTVLCRTDSSVTCFRKDEQGPDFNCTDYSRRFKDLTDYCKPMRVTRVAGAQLSNGQYLFLIHSHIRKNEYDQLLLNADGTFNGSKVSKTPLPTALTSLRNYNGKTETLIVFFDEIMAYYEYDPSRNNLLTINTKIDYESSLPWLNCEPQFCFDGRLDSISRKSQGDYPFQIRKGRYVRFLSEFSSGKWVKIPSPHEAIDRLPDIVNRKEAFLHSHGANCYIEEANRPRSYLCVNLLFNLPLISSAGHPDAIFVIDATRLIYIVSGEKYITYRADAHLRYKFEYIEHGWLSDLWSGLPRDIDGATRSNYERFTFTRDNFVFTTDASTMKRNGTVEEVKLIQEAFKLDKCDDQYYNNSKEATLLGISSFEEFKTYRLQFDPRITGNKPLSTSSTEMTSRTRKMPRTSKMTQRRTKLITKILLMVLIGLVCALIVSFAILKLRSKGLKQSLSAVFSTTGTQRPSMEPAEASETSKTRA
ncbi:hypothetical protein HDE_14366 [Halotydeus destructor]|nr:hypothetical protein HDE_14366 [Halotydeus destructor]